MNIIKLIPILLLISCTQANQVAETAIDLEKTCGYLLTYAQGIKAAVVAKDYHTAIELTNAAYAEAKTQEGRPCLESAFYLVSETHKFINDNVQKDGEE